MGVKGRIKKEIKERVPRNPSFHDKLVKEGARWLNKRASNIYLRCQYVVTEFSCQGTMEIPDIFGLRPVGNVLIEVKTSRSDYFRDSKKPARHPNTITLGSQRYYLVPKGLITEEDLMDGWGLLEYYQGKIEVIRHSAHFEESFQQAGYVYYSIIRRMNKQQVFNFTSDEKSNN